MPQAEPPEEIEADGADPGSVPESEDTGPERRCIVTGRKAPKDELLRFAVGPDGTLFPDLGHVLPGRGFWLSAHRDVVNTAVTKRLFSRAARRAVSVPEGLADRIEALLLRRCLDGLGLARRAGHAVCGFEKVCAEVRSGRAALVLAARDAAGGGREKVRALVAGRVPVLEVFYGAELGAVFGRDEAVHVCLSPGKLARRLREDATLLGGFRGDTPADPTQAG